MPSGTPFGGKIKERNYLCLTTQAQSFEAQNSWAKNPSSLKHEWQFSNVIFLHSQASLATQQAYTAVRGGEPGCPDMLVLPVQLEDHLIDWFKEQSDHYEHGAYGSREIGFEFVHADPDDEASSA